MSATQPNFCAGSQQRVASGTRQGTVRIAVAACPLCGRKIPVTVGGRLRNHSNKVAA